MNKSLRILVVESDPERVRQMQSEMQAAKQALEDRKTIDRAEGILMRKRGLSE